MAGGLLRDRSELEAILRDLADELARFGASAEGASELETSYGEAVRSSPLGAAHMIGVTLNSPEPMGNVNVRLDRGPVVLYGRNGAGKTTCLNALVQALRNQAAIGRRVRAEHALVASRALVHCNVVAELDATSSTLGHRLTEAVADALDPYGRSSIARARNHERPTLRTLLHRFAEQHQPRDERSSFAGIIDEGLISLRPSGHGEWDLYVSASPDVAQRPPVVALRTDASEWPDLLNHLQSKSEADRAEQIADEYVERGGHPRPSLDTTPPSDHRATLARQLAADIADESLQRRPGETFLQGTELALAGFAIPATQLAPQFVGFDLLPSWVPVPMAFIARVRPVEWRAGPVALFDVITEDSLDDASLLDRTLRRALWLAGDDLGIGHALHVDHRQGTIQVDSDFLEALEALAARATGLYADCLLDAPELRCRLKEPEQWITSAQSAVWEAFDVASRQWLPLHQLSHAQRRWACLAIQLATVGDNQAVLIIDEPEVALHRTAERHLAQNVPALTARAVVSSHSPELLRIDAVLMHVYRNDDGFVVASDLEPSGKQARELQALTSLGLNFVDLIHIYRVIVLVEGDHDEIVLSARLADEIRRSRAYLLPLGGTHALGGLAEARFVFDMTDCPILIVTDTLAERAREIVEQVSSHMGREETPAATATAVNGMKDEHAEVQAVAAFLEAAVRRGRWSRIHFHQLGKRDILNFLPVEEFLPGYANWDVAWERYKRQAKGRPTGTDYKRWIRNQPGALLTKTHIATVAMRSPSDALDMPSDLDAVGVRLLELAGVPAL